MTTTADHPFRELTKRIKKGHDDAMGELARTYSPGMLKFADLLVGGPLRSQLDAEDLVQSVLVTIWLGIRTGKFVVLTPEYLMALAKTLLRRQVARHWRKIKAEMSVTQEAALMDTIVDQQLIPTAPAEAGPYEQTAFEDMMDKFLGELTETDRQLVKLRFRGFTTADAAHLLQLEPGYLRVRLIRLREKFATLRRELIEHA